MPKPLIKSATPAAPAAPAPAPTPEPKPKPEPKAEVKPAPKAEAPAPKAPAPKVAREERAPKPPPKEVVPPKTPAPPPPATKSAPAAGDVDLPATKMVGRRGLLAPLGIGAPVYEYTEGAPEIVVGPATTMTEEELEPLKPYLEAVKRVEQLRRERKIGPEAAGVGPIPALPWQTEQTLPAYLSRSSISANPKGIDESQMGRRLVPFVGREPRSIRPILGEIQSPTKEALDRPLQAAVELQDIDRRWKENRAQSRVSEETRVALEEKLRAARKEADQLDITRPDLSSSERAALAREMLRPIQADLEKLAMSQRRRTQIRAALEASRREYGMLPEEEAATPTEAPPTE